MSDTRASGARKVPIQLKEHIVEIISDSGEGAQKCGQSLGTIAAHMDNGVWTTEIIPAEIRPTAATRRIWFIAFNEQVLLGRVRAKELKPDCIILLEDMWRTDPDASVVASYIETHDRLVNAGYRVHEVPMERECRTLVADARQGKNMFALGMLCQLYSLHLGLAREQIIATFGKKDQRVVDANIQLLDAGHAWAESHLDFLYVIPAKRSTVPQIVVSGNTSLALGVLVSGMEVCAMYPLTPATSASHYLAEVFENVGGIVHQAEDEIAACAFAIGASYASKCTWHWCRVRAGTVP